jgi:hypothetical protein
VHWYEAIFRVHGLASEIANGMWTSRGTAPPYYSNAVTLAASGKAAQMATLQELGTAIARPWSVKDSFSILDLTPLGFRPLFDAEWIWRPPLASSAGPGRPDVKWRRVQTPAELERWEGAWNENGSPADSRVFLPALLANEAIALFGAYRGQAVAAGCAANRSSQAVGFSNFFSSTDDDSLLAGAVSEVHRFAPTLPVVGYERGEALARVKRLGFRTVGPLRVWISGGA